jgi:hypothetical protein
MDTPRIPKLVKPEPKLGPEAGLYDDGHYRMYPPTEEDLAREAEAERAWREDNFYTVDEAGTRITGFRRELPLFANIRDVLASHGIDIESITDPEEMEALIGVEKYGYQIMAVVEQRLLAGAHKSTAAALMAAVVRGDTEAADCLGEKLKRRRAMGLKVVK